MDTVSPRQVGKSALSVSPLGFGGAPIGSPQVPTGDAIATVAAAWDSGVRLFDTAPWYGIGRSERRTGVGLEGLGARDDYRINTKIGKTLVPEPVRDESRKTLSPGGQVRTPRDAQSGFRAQFEYTHDSILAQHQASLQRLGHSAVNSLTIHDIDYGYHGPDEIEQHLEELSRDGGGGALALEELRESGAIQAIGCGCNREMRNTYSWPGGEHERLIERIVDLVDLDFLIIAGPYTLLDTSALARILPLCQERGIGVIGASPLAGGWLATRGESDWYMYGSAPAEVVDRSQRVAAICDRHGTPMTAAALQFPLAHPCVAAIIPGAINPAQATQNRQLLDLEIPVALWDDLKNDGLLDQSAPVPAAS